MAAEHHLELKLAGVGERFGKHEDRLTPLAFASRRGPAGLRITIRRHTRADAAAEIVLGVAVAHARELHPLSAR